MWKVQAPQHQVHGQVSCSTSFHAEGNLTDVF